MDNFLFHPRPLVAGVARCGPGWVEAEVLQVNDLSCAGGPRDSKIP